MRLLLMDGEEHCGALNEWPQMAWGIKVAGAVVRKLTQAKSQNNEWMNLNINGFGQVTKYDAVLISFV